MKQCQSIIPIQDVGRLSRLETWVKRPRKPWEQGNREINLFADASCVPGEALVSEHGEEANEPGVPA